MKMKRSLKEEEKNKSLMMTLKNITVDLIKTLTKQKIKI